MTVSRFYPYATVPEGVQLQLRTVEPSTAVADDGSLWAADDELAEVHLELAVSVDESVIEKVLPPHERQDPCTRLVLVARNTEGRRRQAFDVPDDGVVCLDLARDEWVGLVELYATVARSQAAPSPTDGYASHSGALLAWSNPLHLRFDEPTERSGDLLPVRWVRFTELPDLQTRSRHLFALNPQNPPELLLNADVLELRAVLDSKGTHGAKARIRDAVFMQLAHQVWTSLLVTALASLTAQADSSDEDPGDELLDDLAPWEAAVLRRWGAELFPEVEGDSVIPILVETAASSNASELFIVRIPNAIQKRVQSYKAFEGLVKDTGLRTALEGQ